MNSLIETLNLWGGRIPDFAWPMLWQSSVLIAALFVFDLAARRKVRASVRYALWLVVLVKLLLPPTLALPTGLAWWVRPPAPPPQAPARTTAFVVTYGDFVLANFPTPAPPVFVPPPKPSLSGAGRAAATWVVVGAGLLAWFLGRWRLVARDVRRATLAPANVVSGSPNELLDEARRSIKFSRRVRLRLTQRAMSPAVCGLFRPVILLPQALVKRLTPSQLRAVLLHELVHLRRGDVWVNCVQALLQIFYWWHPLLWLANARIRRVREEAVDDAVMLTLADDGETYAPTLLEVAKLAFNRSLASLGLVGILESRSALRQRIERLVDFRPPQKAGLTIASALCVVAFAALAVPMEKAPPTSEKPSSTKDKSDSSGTISTVQTSSNSADSRTNATRLVQRGRLLLEAGKLDEAETELKLAIRMEPDNRHALYYLRLVSETRLARAERPSAERAPVLGDEPLVGRLFRTESTSTPNTSTREALSTRTFRLDMKAFYQRLEGVTGPSLDNVQESAFNPGVLLLPGVSLQEVERTRDLVTLSPDLAQTQDRGGITYITRTNDMQRVSVAAARFFSSLGADLASPNAIASGKSIFWSDRSGLLLVRATKQDLDVIERGLADLEATPASGTNATESPSSVVAGVNQVMGLANSRLEAITNKVPVLGDIPLVGRLFRSGSNAFRADAFGTSNSPTESAGNSRLAAGPASELPSSSGSEQLHTRIFKLDPDTFYKGLESVSSLAVTRTNVRVAVATFFSSLGVDLSPPKSVFWNDRNGGLFVRATTQDLDIIEKAIEVLSRAPPQINIQTHFVEIDQAETPALGWDWYVGNIQLVKGAVTNSVSILTDPQFRVVLRALEQRKGADVLAAPSVTTVSGRQAQIQVVEMRTVVTGINSQAQLPPGVVSTNGITNSPYQTQTLPFGPVLDVIPYLAADGYTINMTVIPTVTEFLGYDDPAIYGLTNSTAGPDKTGLPLPHFRVRQMTVTANVLDGQTLVLTGPLITEVIKKPDGSTETKDVSNTQKKLLIVFVTPTLVDEAGNRLHSDDEPAPGPK